MRQWSWFLALALALAVAAIAVLRPGIAHASSGTGGDEIYPTGPSQFVFEEWDGPALPVWTFIPEGINRTTAPIVLVMHGARRDADRYRDQWIEPAKAGGFIVIAPAFSKADFPKAAGYNLGGVFDTKSNVLRDEDRWAFSAIEPLFDTVVTSLGGTQSRYSIYGHSAGSQFVHRFLFFKPDARVERYMAANAGWYTFARPDIAFPFGLGGLAISEERLRHALAKDLVVLLGDADSDPNARLLNKSKGALKQGPHRFARGQAFYAAARSYAKAKGWEFGWSLRVVKGVGHSNGAMAPKAAELIR